MYDLSGYYIINIRKHEKIAYGGIMVVAKSQIRQSEKTQANIQQKPVDVSQLKFNMNELRNAHKAAVSRPITSHPAMKPAVTQTARTATAKINTDNSPKLDPNLDEIIRDVEQSYNMRKVANGTAGKKGSPVSQVDSIIYRMKVQNMSARQEIRQHPRAVLPASVKKNGVRHSDVLLKPRNIK